MRAVISDGRRIAVPPKVAARDDQRRDRRDADRRSWKQVVERGTAQGARRSPATPIAGKTGTAAKLVNGRYSTSDYNASFVGFVPSRKPALTIIVVIDSPHGNGYTGGAVVGAGLQAHRRGGAAPSRRRRRRSIAPPPVLVARHEPRDDAGARRSRRAPPACSSATSSPRGHG